MASKLDTLKSKRAEADSKKTKAIDPVTASIMHPEDTKSATNGNKTKRISLIVDEDVFQKIESECKKLRLTKNGYINMILAKELFSGH